METDIREECGCDLCDSDDIYSMVLYIPTDNGESRDVSLNFCPKCGRKIDI